MKAIVRRGLVLLPCVVVTFAAASPLTRRDSGVTAADRGHWSYQPLRAVEPPAVRDATWGRTSIDRFVLAALEARGIRPNPPADRRTLVRRLYFDLVGLSPAPDVVESFVADPAPDAYDKLV